MFMFGFWIMGNKQIFSNEVSAREHKSDPVITHHKGYEIIPDQSLALFIMACLTALFLFVSGLLHSILGCFGIDIHNKEIEVDEKLGTYYECLGKQIRKAWLVEEMHKRRDLGVKNLTDDMINHCKTSHSHNKIMRGIPNYEITWNTRYASMFQFTPVEMRDT
jgi:hypothetical protein